MNTENFSSLPMDSVRYMIHHVFLPTKLPQVDDFDSEHEAALLKTTSEALDSLVDLSNHQLAVKDVKAMVQNARLLHTGANEGAINESRLKTALQDLCIHGGFIPLCVRAQNAGLILSKVENNIFFEAFELSPTNESVMKTKGRLGRHFPAAAISISCAKFSENGLQGALAQALAKMSYQSAAGTQPKVRKAGEMHIEDRDTNHPKLVTEYLMGMVQALGSSIQVSGIWKKTREEVLWQGGLLPWRRSPMWLLIRVTAQVMFLRHESSSKSGETYKHLLILIMTRILNMSMALESDILYSLNAKISRRLLKLHKELPDKLQTYIRDSLTKAHANIEIRWSKIIRETSRSLNLTDLETTVRSKDVKTHLPNLNKFIQSIDQRQNRTGCSNFAPTDGMPYFAPDKLPCIPRDFPPGSKSYVLAAFESWVETYLRSWIEHHAREESTCMRMSSLIRSYHELAAPHYLQNPEGYSIMLLNLLELWIACDKSARILYDLLPDYDPGIPSQILQSLLLPFQSQLGRLNKIEVYLKNRGDRCDHSLPNIFTSFGRSSTFASRYFDKSSNHKALRSNIEEAAQADRNAKQQELAQKQKLYYQLIEKYDQSDCEWYDALIDWEYRIYENRHRPSCQKCRYLEQASAIDIYIHEWPLPSDQTKANCVVFELMLPSTFGHWRDTTLFLLVDVLKCKYQDTDLDSTGYTLSTYDGLSTYLKLDTGQQQRLILRSATKPHTGTHRSLKSINNITEADVCLENGLNFHYYDYSKSIYSTVLTATDAVPKLCLYLLPKRSSALKPFLWRPPSLPNGPSPNTAIATRAHCPDHMNLTEYDAYCGVPFGIQWVNVLTQLSTLWLDFGKLETHILMLLVAYQAGPSHNFSILRDNHEFLSKKKFGAKLIQRLTMRVQGIKENWESWRALSTFVHLATRLLSLTSSAEVQSQCTEFLTLTRRTAFGWMKHVRGRANVTANDKQQTELMVASIDIALTCLSTFNVDFKFLEPLLASPMEASIYIQTSVSIQECLHSVQSLEGENDKLRKVHLHRREKLSHRVISLLQRQVIDFKSTCLNEAVLQSWPDFMNENSWKRCAAPCQHWLFCTTAARADKLSVTVHINLLTFELLVNGRPLARLPSMYLSHSYYPDLFGRSTLEAVPATLAGMDFSCKTKYNGYTINMALQDQLDNSPPSEPDFLLHAANEDQQWDLVPKRIFRGSFPDSFVEDYAHWYHRNRNAIEFRPIKKPWFSDRETWLLTKMGKSWRLSKDKQSLISVNSNSAKFISGLLSTIETPLNIHIYHCKNTRTFEVEVPILSLGFYYKGTGHLIHSRQYPGMVIDGYQNIDTLVGLNNKLVLCSIKEVYERQIIIPDGPIRYYRAGEHVSVNVLLNEAHGHYSYRINSRLERLDDSGGMKGKLFLCYLHGLTSYCLPDPFTQRTGVEQAIEMLRSGSMRSFETLNSNDFVILKKIAGLTPKRNFYPRHERVMQTVEWDNELSSLTQHNHFYKLVKEIFKQSEDTKIFYSDTHIDHPQLEAMTPHLLERDSVRVSTFQVSKYGAEDHTSSYDVVYTERDRSQNSAEAQRTFAVAKAIDNGGVVTDPRTFNSSPELLWNLIEKQETMKSISHPIPVSEICFDSKWLQNPVERLSSLWIVIHDSLRNRKYQYNKFSVLTWLSAAAFSDKANMLLIHAVAAFYNSAGSTGITIPTGGPFDLQLGISATVEEIKSLVQEHGCHFEACPESKLPNFYGESLHALSRRRQNEFQSKRYSAFQSVSNYLCSQWPCEVPEAPRSDDFWTYVNGHEAMRAIRSYFKVRHDNLRIYRYLSELQNILGRDNRLPVNFTFENLHLHPINNQTRARFVAEDSLFMTQIQIPPQENPFGTAFDMQVPVRPRTPSAQLQALISKLESRAATQHDLNYAKQLRASSLSLQEHAYETLALPSEQLIESYLKYCKGKVSLIYSAMKHNISDNCDSTREIAARIGHWPRVSSTLFLAQLRYDKWPKLMSSWKRVILDYALAVTEVQRAERLLKLSGNKFELAIELSNIGHRNWDPFQFPESVLLEVESEILIRDVQGDIACQMRNPPSSKNSVMQLNMGEGKSSVIVPIVVINLADGQLLVRVVVGKPQSKQMASMLVAKVGGLLGRRVYRMPFSRALRLNPTDIQTIDRLCRECIQNRGILLVQPEHILSFRLMGIESAINGRDTLARSLFQTQHLFSTSSRDIVDESDENFSVKFELVYTMGSQRHIELSPERWQIVHRILRVLAQVVMEIQRDMGMKFVGALEVDASHSERYPRIRILNDDAEKLVMRKVATAILEHGFPGFPVAHQTGQSKKAILKYITKINLNENEILEVENNVHGSFWAESTQSTLLLIRGLIAGGVLSFAFRTKRWRVNYGLDWSRSPGTRLAVPYRAKDMPAPRAEFSHPDALLVLTSLSYYYGGLENSDLFDSFEHLMKSDQDLVEFGEWTKSAPSLPSSFRTLAGINLKDRDQCINSVFPHLRYSKGAIDYFLSHLVFSKEMREFPSKISASGWDLGEPKVNPTTGFSGTNDSRHVLPLDIKQLDLTKQKHTNALVLENILREENSVHLMSRRLNPTESDAQHLLTTVLRLDPKVRVILDVGAQVLEMNNIQVAMTWLEMCSGHDSVKAVIYINNKDEVCVIDRKGNTELLEISPFAKQLGVCLVYLDEAHTRGIDLKLPYDYRAAVTLGAGITKDRLVQAVMRMRKLGQGQSIIFCIPEEIKIKIQNSSKSGIDSINVADVLLWAFQETMIDLRRSLPLWAVQGRRFEQQSLVWEQARHNSGIELSTSLAEEFLEDEAQSLDHRYRPRHLSHDQELQGWDLSSTRMFEIVQRCRAFESCNFQNANVEEEQERELSPEIENERQVETPALAQPNDHYIHPHLKYFAETGCLWPQSPSFQPAFESLRWTSIATSIDVSQFPKDLLVTKDFAKTVKMKDTTGATDIYQRPVQWILSATAGSKTHMIIISPFEAHGLKPIVTQYKISTLHTYAPRTHMELSSLDRLDLFTIGRAFVPGSIPRHLIIQLNLFAGQSYFGSFDEYKEFCDLLQLAWSSVKNGRTVMADGFIKPTDENKTGFRQNPVKFVRSMMSSIRGHGEGIDKTHVGRVLGGELLGEDEFSE